MKATCIQQFSRPEFLNYGDLPDPAPAPGQVVVDTVAAGANWGADSKVCASDYADPKFPVIPRPDNSGVVSASMSPRARFRLRCQA